MFYSSQFSYKNPSEVMRHMFLIAHFEVMFIYSNSFVLRYKLTSASNTIWYVSQIVSWVGMMGRSAGWSGVKTLYVLDYESISNIP